MKISCPNCNYKNGMKDKGTVLSCPGCGHTATKWKPVITQRKKSAANQRSGQKLSWWEKKRRQKERRDAKRGIPSLVPPSSTCSPASGESTGWTPDY